MLFCSKAEKFKDLILEVSSQDSSSTLSLLGANINEKYSQDLDVDYCKKSLKVDPQNAISHFNMGKALSVIGNIEAAIASFKKALSIKPDYAEVHYCMGNVMHDNGDLEGAIISYKKALRIQPDYAHAYNNMGNALKNKGELGAAIVSYKQALKIKPNLTDTLNNLGHTLNQNGDTRAAMETFQQALNINPNYAATYKNIGSVLKENGNIEGALEAFKQALNIEPDCATTYGKIGTAFMEMGNTEVAIEAFKQVLNIEPGHLIAQHILAALTGKQTVSVPNNYIEELFDGYAAKFDDGLVKKLEYKLPKLIADLISKYQTDVSIGSILDLGCGTGLAGVEFKEFCHNIEGIDLSKKMLTEAKRKNVYDTLNHTGIIEYLSEATLDFDLFIAADVFVYVGELSEVFQLIKSRNKRKGMLVFSTEHTEKKGFFLEASERFSHSRGYIQGLCEEFDYKLLHFSKCNLRKEKGEILTGGLYLLEF